MDERESCFFVKNESDELVHRTTCRVESRKPNHSSANKTKRQSATELGSCLVFWLALYAKLCLYAVCANCFLQLWYGSFIIFHQKHTILFLENWDMDGKSILILCLCKCKHFYTSLLSLYIYSFIQKKTNVWEHSALHSLSNSIILRII